ncbi:MAG: hypothetical protein ACAH07_06055 [Methylophilaceae bacterium]|nr:hypothetical protein [Methyloradius sp.]
MINAIIWALFGNDDDGIYGDSNWNKTGSKSWWTAIKWWFRNPFHNFCFYVIGFADVPASEYVRKGRYPYSVFSPYGGWNFTVIHYKWLWLPFISFEDRTLGQFYIGWRERANFGIKLNRWLLVFFVMTVSYWRFIR